MTQDTPSITLSLSQQQNTITGQTQCEYVQVGTHAFITLLSFSSEEAFISGCPVHYALHFHDEALQAKWQKECQALLYPRQQHLNFVYTKTPTTILHGSCRKPHYDGSDALAQVDNLIANSFDNEKERPDLLLMTGDQIYADDVAGPMLQAIHQVIVLLGITEEELEGAQISHSSELASHPHCFYEREQLLPQIATNTALSSLFFGAKKKPIFTSVNAQNHLISCAEVMAMYLLVWSPLLWARIKISDVGISPAH